MTNSKKVLLVIIAGTSFLIVPFVTSFIYNLIYRKSIAYSGGLGFSGLGILFLSLIVFIISLFIWELSRKIVSESTAIFLLPIIYLVLNIIATLLFVK